MDDWGLLKTRLQDLRQAIPGQKYKTAKETGGPCQKCGGVDRLYVKEDEFRCRECEWHGDKIDYFAWKEGISNQELLFKYCPELKRESKVDFNKMWAELVSRDGNPEGRAYLYNERGIDREFVAKVPDICSMNYDLSTDLLNQFHFDGTSPHALALAYRRIDGKGDVAAIQYVSTTGKPLQGNGEKKIFAPGSDAKSSFFLAGEPIEKAEQIILVEAPINAITVASILDEACLLAIGSAATTGKLKHLKKRLQGLKKSDCRIISFFDNDPAGEKATKASARILPGILGVEYPSDAKEGWDPNDLLKAGKANVLLEMIENAAPVPVEPAEKGSSSKQSQAARIVEIASLSSDIVLFHTENKEGFISFGVHGHEETYPIRSSMTRSLLSKQYYDEEKNPPSAQALKDAQNVLEAEARFNGLQREVFVRVGESEKTVLLDLGGKGWNFVEITSQGWTIKDSHCPVAFRRPRGMLPLPVPTPGGSLNDLRRFLNVSSDDQFKLFVSWLTGALNPSGPKMVLVIQGPQGSAKSSTAKRLKFCVDPAVSSLRTMPSDERDLMIHANNSWIMSFDNLSGLPSRISDCFCRLATGGGFATRELYTDSEEVIFNATRSLILNGIDAIVHRHDLADRAIIINLEHIDDRVRRNDKDLEAEFREKHPQILGALCDAACAALKNQNAIKTDRLPRMADAASWILAAEPALPWPTGGFISAYNSNREEVIITAIESDLVGSAVHSLFKENNFFEGTASELLTALEKLITDSDKKSKAWPKTPRALSTRLRRASTFLLSIGIGIDFGRDRNQRMINIAPLKHETQQESFDFEAHLDNKMKYLDSIDLEMSLVSNSDKQKAKDLESAFTKVMNERGNPDEFKKLLNEYVEIFEIYAL